MTQLSTFPLYDILLSSVDSETSLKLSNDQKHKLIAYVHNNLDGDGKEILFNIIRVHFLKNNYTDKFKLPYEATKSNETKTDYTVKFDLNKLPGLLQLMLNKFCMMHKSNVITDQERIYND